MRILITGAWNCTKEQIEQIISLGHEVVFMQNESDNLPCDYLDIEGVICNGLFLHHSIEKFKNLRYIQLTSAGFDRVPMDYVNSHGIKINNARGVYSVPMAEFAISGVLQLYKRSKFFINNQNNKTWEKHRGLMELYGKNVCIVGCGSVGTECAKRFNAFGCNVYGVDIFVREDFRYKEILHLSKIDECLSKADVIVLTLPLTEETRYLFNDERFSVIKDGSVLVNIARGAIIKESSLLKALDNKLLGAVIDVFEEEPLSINNLLWKKENVILTPHNSFVGDGNAERLNRLILNNLGENL